MFHYMVELSKKLLAIQYITVAVKCKKAAVIYIQLRHSFYSSTIICSLVKCQSRL